MHFVLISDRVTFAAEEQNVMKKIDSFLRRGDDCNLELEKFNCNR
jgi:hypothetical protein